MTDTAIIITAVLGFLAGAMSISMWLGTALSRVRTERDRLQSVVDGLRNGLEIMARKVDRYKTECMTLTQERDSAVSDCQAMTEKITQLTADCVEFQRLAHEAQEKAERWRRNAEGATGDWMDEQAAHHTTKRQLAAAKGQITKMRKRLK